MSGKLAPYLLAVATISKKTKTLHFSTILFNINFACLNLSYKYLQLAHFILLYPVFFAYSNPCSYLPTLGYIFPAFCPEMGEGKENLPDGVKKEFW